MTWRNLLWVALIGFLIAKLELEAECVQHGKNVGKAMQWNVFGGCEVSK